MKSQTVPWITKAHEDIKAAHILFEAGLSDPACFHAQQAAEKCLKVVLEEYQERIPKTHDLDSLLDRLPGSIVVPTAVFTAAFILTSFAVDIRYPGTEADMVDAQDALVHAKVIMDWVTPVLNGAGK